MFKRFSFASILLNCCFYFLCCFALSYGQLSRAQDKLLITIPPKEKTSELHAAYFPALLHLALAKTEATDGPFDIVEYPQHLTGARFMAELKRHGVVDVIWTVESPQVEAGLLAIKVPILKDLNSYRIFLIRSEDQNKFDQVNTLADLRKYTAGQGAHWADTSFFVENDLPVVTTAQFELLFTMLAGKRFDYFPRGLDEVWNEVALLQNKGISIEKHLMLHYKANKYFYVAKDNLALANRIERGIKIAQSDGSFDVLFNSIPGYKRGLQELQDNKRLVFHLSNETE